MALASLTDEKDAIRIINSEFIKRGVKSKFTLIEAIKEAAYPELIQEKEKIYGLHQTITNLIIDLKLK